MCVVEVGKDDKHFLKKKVANVPEHRVTAVILNVLLNLIVTEFIYIRLKKSLY
jgi:hypothetical protein